MSAAQATSAIVDFASQLRFEDIPREVVEHCKLVMLDALGCAIAATTAGDACSESIAALGAGGDCSIFGTQARAGAANAAFLNGALIHALNFDATGEVCGHQGVVCLAAPFALGEASGRSGRDLVVASVVACEIGARITAAIARTGRHPSEKFLAGQLLSYHGAAAGAARMLGLDREQTHSALGLALMQMAGSRQVVLQGDPPAKSIYGGFPNQAAAQSALLAQAGVDARCELFAGPAGLYEMIYGGVYHGASLSEDLGRTYVLLDGQIKPWPCSKKIHAFVAAALSLRQLIADPGRITRIDILAPESLRPWCEPAEHRQRPANASAAANSVQYCVAKALLNGRLSPDDFAAQARADAPTLRLTDNTIARVGEDETATRICVTLDDGGAIEASAAGASDSGSAATVRTLTREKFHDCCRLSRRPFAAQEVKTLADAFLNLEDVRDLRDLFGPLSG